MLSKYSKKSVFSECDISTDEHLINAANEMDKGLSFLGINDYDLDNLSSTLLDTYDKQQKIVLEEKCFHFSHSFLWPCWN